MRKWTSRCYTTFFGNSSRTTAIRGSRKHFGGGIGTSGNPLASFSTIHGSPSSQVFPSPTDTSDGRQDLRDTEGPTMRELLEVDYAVRVNQGVAPEPGI